MNHGDLVNLILLDVSPMGLFWSNRTGAMKVDERMLRWGLVGSSDILGCRKGRMVGIEAKIGDDEWRKRQQDFAKALTEAGGLYILARSTDGCGNDAIAHVASLMTW